MRIDVPQERGPQLKLGRAVLVETFVGLVFEHMLRFVHDAFQFAVEFSKTILTLRLLGRCWNACKVSRCQPLFHIPNHISSFELPFGFFALCVTVPCTASWCRFKLPVRLKFLPHSLHVFVVDCDGTSVSSVSGWMASARSPSDVDSIASIFIEIFDLSVLFSIFSKLYKSSFSELSSTASHSTTEFWSNKIDRSNEVELGAISSTSTSIGSGAEGSLMMIGLSIDSLLSSEIKIVSFSVQSIRITHKQFSIAYHN